MPSVAEIIVKTLVKAGVKRIYGIPGDSIDPLMDAIRRNKEIKYVQVRHEEGAAFAASVEAKLTGSVTACMGTSGPGSIHLLNGLYDAKMDHAPVVALTGQVESDMLGHDYFQEVNMVKLFDDVAVYNQIVINPKNAGYLIWRAIHEAKSKSGVSHLNLPVDILRMDGEEYDADLDPPKVSYDYPDIDKAVELIDKSKSPVVMIGGGTKGYSQLISQFSERIGAPVIYALNGKGVLSDFDERVMGGIGLLGTKPSVEALDKTDLLILLGTSFPYVNFLPKGVDVIQVDSNPSNIGKRVRATVEFVGDVSDFLSKILPRVKEKDDKFYVRMKDSKEKWFNELNKKESDMSKPMKPQMVAYELSKVFTEGVVVVDTGNVTMWGARNFRASGNQRFVFSAWLGSMGIGVPGAVGASFVYDKVLALVGDGGFAMTMMELITAKKYSRPIKVVVFNNSKLGMIKFEQEVMGYPEWGVDLYNPDFSKLAEAIGIKGITVEDPKDLPSAIKEMSESEEPFVLNAIVDPNERPMPPKLTFTQAKNYVLSVFREKLEPSEEE
ncbi:thiamine pyrophosphate-dependent enzyme [Saccharolobus shibatae]|uniref:Pyruvate dehydrogenase (Quinone) n=1 Tax=Saccharolobus shibatae TaxID=2286 RepID=A0A8F5C1A0_9CREN|nr:thiamine pyrophosphate-dependent enzyme [Saccharolobus shibatae]QXJ35287.1 Pyruvate dehydrogenase (quinone) [Saccharolobus shibatae]